VVTDPQTHAQTHTYTHKTQTGLITIHCAAASLARNVMSVTSVNESPSANIFIPTHAAVGFGQLAIVVDVDSA